MHYKNRQFYTKIIIIYIQQMEDRPSLKCLYGHPAKELCIEKGCNNPSVICDREDCNSYKHHYDCNVNIKVQKFINSLMKKGSSAFQMKDYILEVYTHCEKMIKRDKEQYLKTINNTGFKLQGDEKKLFELITRGTVKEILPKLVSQVNKSLKGKPQTDMGQANVQLAEQTETVKQNIENVLMDLKEIWKNEKQQLNGFTFNKELFSKKSLQITRDMKKVRRTAQDDNLCYFALISPCLQIGHPFKRFEFKLLKGQGIYFGIGFQNNLKKKRFKDLFSAGLNSGTYYVKNVGFTYNHHNQLQDHFQTELRYCQGDTVIMEVDMRSCKLTVFNKIIPKKKALINFRREIGNQLYALVGIVYQKNIVELVSVSE